MEEKELEKKLLTWDTNGDGKVSDDDFKMYLDSRERT